MTGANRATRLSFGNQIFGSGAFLKDFDGTKAKEQILPGQSLFLRNISGKIRSRPER